MANSEAEIHQNIQKHLESALYKLRDELKYAKIIIRYPKLYFKYQDKGFDYIKSGLKNDYEMLIK